MTMMQPERPTGNLDERKLGAISVIQLAWPFSPHVGAGHHQKLLCQHHAVLVESRTIVHLASPGIGD
jgi:hypothetical protein